MQDERTDLGSPKGWLRRAKSNLIRAKQPKHEEVFWEDLCFDAQQAVEALYPGPMEPVTEDEYKEAVKIAEMVVSWVDSFIMPDTEETTDHWQLYGGSRKIGALMKKRGECRKSQEQIYDLSFKKSIAISARTSERPTRLQSSW